MQADILDDRTCDEVDDASVSIYRVAIGKAFARTIPQPKSASGRRFSVSEQLDILLQIGVLLGRLLAPLGLFIVHWLPFLLWIAWWLWAANWKKVWPVLAEGAWVPVLLLLFAAALAWSQLSPSACNCIGITVPNFWWQLGGLGLLAVITLLCGWVQGLLNWPSAEISLEPPVAGAHNHGHH